MPRTIALSLYINSIFGIPANPKREFNNPFFSMSGDLAYSETFAWGVDMYGNWGICFTPLLPFGSRVRPLSVSFALDGAGERFVYRDGLNHGAGFRNAGKIEWKGKRNSLFRLNTVLRSPGIGEDFTRSSSGLYYRFPAANKDSPPVRLTVLSLTAYRNAANLQRISDGLSANMGISIGLPKIAKSSPLGVNFSWFVRGLTTSSGSPSPYPFFYEPGLENPWVFDTAGVNCELFWSTGIFQFPGNFQFPLNLQFRSRLGYTMYEKKDDKWDFSMSVAARFKKGRLSIKANSPDFPENWNWTVSWRLERD